MEFILSFLIFYLLPHICCWASHCLFSQLPIFNTFYSLLMSILMFAIGLLFLLRLAFLDLPQLSQCLPSLYCSLYSYSCPFLRLLISSTTSITISIPTITYISIIIASIEAAQYQGQRPLQSYPYLIINLPVIYHLIIHPPKQGEHACNIRGNAKYFAYHWIWKPDY